MDLRFYFGEDRRLPCPFPIVKAISVRPQYFKDETKQSICVGNQKSPLVSPFSKEQGFGSSSSRDLPFPHPTLLGPCVISQGASVYVYVCGGEPSCTPIVCLFLFFILVLHVPLVLAFLLGVLHQGTLPLVLSEAGSLGMNM